MIIPYTKNQFHKDTYTYTQRTNFIKIHTQRYTFSYLPIYLPTVPTYPYRFDYGRYAVFVRHEVLIHVTNCVCGKIPNFGTCARPWEEAWTLINGCLLIYAVRWRIYTMDTAYHTLPMSDRKIGHTNYLKVDVQADICAVWQGALSNWWLHASMYIYHMYTMDTAYHTLPMSDRKIHCQWVIGKLVTQIIWRWMFKQIYAPFDNAPCLPRWQVMPTHTYNLPSCSALFKKYDNA